MINKIFSLYIFLAIFPLAGVIAFADQPSSSITNKQSMDSTANSQLQTPEKEKQRKEEINKQALEVYDQAVDMYKHKKYTEAKKKFEEVNWVIPDYKATKKYLARIDREIQQENLYQQRLEEKRLHDQEFRDKTDKTQKIYDQAMGAYRAHQWQEAKAQFETVEQMIPGYKHTRRYLKKTEIYISKGSSPKPASINTPAPIPPTVVATPQSLALPAPASIAVITLPEAENFHQQELVLEHQRAQELKNNNEQAEKIYSTAVKSYHAHQWQESRSQFENVEQLVPGYKHTHRYLQKLDDIIRKTNESSVPTPVEVPVPSTPAALAPMPVAPPPAPTPTPTPTLTPTPTPSAAVETPAPEPPAVPPVQIKAVSIEDQQKQALDIAALAEKSAQLYHQIADVADDESTVQTKKKMAEVDDMLKNLKDNKERVLHQMQVEQYRRQKEQLKAKELERRDHAEKLYHDGLGFLRSHEYAKAKIKFLELDSIFPDYRATRRYLLRSEEDLKRANVEAVTVNEKNESAHLRKLQDKESTAEITQIQKEEDKEQLQEQQQQASLKELAQKASDINDDIIRLSQQQDYEAMKVKFVELEKTVTALTTLKDEMSNQKGRKERSKQLVHEAVVRHNEMIKEQNEEDRQIHAYGLENPLMENRPILSNQPSDADYFKQREIMQEQNTMYNEGVDLYEHKKYTQAKLIFGELSNQHDRRAEAWLKKVDHAITHVLLNSEEAEARERTAFLQDQLNAQRELVTIQERERQRQKKLTEELERQKRLFEDDRQLQLRKEETMKIQERERQRQEEKRLRTQGENEKKQEMFHFHKVITVVRVPPPKAVVPVAQPKKVITPVAPVPVLAAAVVVKPPVLSAKQLQDQNQKTRKAMISAQEDVRQKRLAQRDAERRAKLKAKADARQKRDEERQKQRERQEELRAQREAERQARLKAQLEARHEQEKARAEKKAEEQKRREEFLHQQEEQRQEKIRQEQIVRQEAQHQQEMEAQERQRQSQLEAQRESVRKQLEDGVEAMYQDALNLFQEGNYSAAADRFKDVQDIIPGYKRSEQYMDEAREKSLTVKSQAVVVPESTVDKSNASAPPAEAASASTPVSRQDNVSKALDIFEPNAK